MKVYKITLRSEFNGRVAGAEGYLVKQKDDEDAIEGYFDLLSISNEDRIRFVKGLLTKQGKLAFIQMSNNSDVKPSCYCFENVYNEGFWSEYNMGYGFFPLHPGMACSNGRALIQVQEVDGIAIQKEASETISVYNENLENATKLNKDLITDYRSLTDLWEQNILLQMKLHCGKW